MGLMTQLECDAGKSDQWIADTPVVLRVRGFEALSIPVHM